MTKRLPLTESSASKSSISGHSAPYSIKLSLINPVRVNKPFFGSGCSSKSTKGKSSLLPLTFILMSSAEPFSKEVSSHPKASLPSCFG